MLERTCAYLVIVTVTTHNCIEAKQLQVPTSDRGDSMREYFIRLINGQQTIVRAAEGTHLVEYPLNSALSASAPIDGCSDLRTGMVLRAFWDKHAADCFMDMIQHLDSLLC